MRITSTGDKSTTVTPADGIGVKTAQDKGFVQQVKVSVWINLPKDKEKEYEWELEDEKTTVYFDIDEEWRSWGMKSARVDVKRIHPVSVRIFGYDDQFNEVPVKTLVLNIDTSQLQLEVRREDAITVGDLEITADANGVIDYSRSSIVAYRL